MVELRDLLAEGGATRYVLTQIVEVLEKQAQTIKNLISLNAMPGLRLGALERRIEALEDELKDINDELDELVLGPD